MIFIHSLSQPLIVRSHSKVHRSWGNPKEIPRWASRVSNCSYFPWFNRQHMASNDRFVAVGEEEILYIISNIFAKPQVFYYLVSDAKIFDIIYQCSPLLECDPTVCLPRKVRSPSGKPSGDLTFLWETNDISKNKTNFINMLTVIISPFYPYLPPWMKSAVRLSGPDIVSYSCGVPMRLTMLPLYPLKLNHH